MVVSHISPPQSAVVSLIGGTCSGVVCGVLFQPLDFFKTQLQSDSRKYARGLSGFLASRTALKEGLIRGLWWRGLWPSLVKTVPGVSCYFFTLSQLRKLYGEDQHLHPLSAVALGAAARSLTVVVVQPLTLIKTRYECGQFPYTSISGAISAIYRERGLPGLYRGTVATILRDAPFSGLYLAFYTRSKQKLFSGSDHVTA